MVQKLSYTANSITLGTGTSRVILGADSGNLIVKDSDANTSILEPGLGVQGSAAVSTYANPGALPFSPISSAGSLAYTTSTGALYMSNGSGWYKISLVNTSPSITLNRTEISPTTTSLTLDVNYTTNEPEGTPVSVTYSNSGISTTDVATVTHTTSNNNIRVVFDGETGIEGATIVLTVTDGVNTGTGTITINTNYQKLNTRFTHGSFQASNDNGFVKEVTNNAGLISETNTPIKGSFSPYRSGGYAYMFDGSNDYIKFKDSGNGLVFDWGTGDYTVEGWIYPHGTGNCDVIDLRSSSMNQGVALTLKSGNKIWPYYGGSQFATGNIAIPEKKWSHIALVRSSGTLKSYVNGKEDISTSDTTNRNGTGTNEPTVGANYGGASKFDGVLYDWRVTNNAVYTAEFIPPTNSLQTISGTQLHVLKGPYLKDYSNRDADIQILGQPEQVPQSPYDVVPHKNTDHGGSIRFESEGHYLSFDQYSGVKFTSLTNSTITFWFYLMSNASYNHIISIGDASTREYAIRIGPTTYGVYWSTNGASSGDSSVSFTPAQGDGIEGVPLRMWCHAAFVKEGSSMYCYINGKKVGNNATFTSAYSGTGIVRLGNQFMSYGSIAHGAPCFISDFQITNTVAYSGSTYTVPTKPTTLTGSQFHLPMVNHTDLIDHNSSTNFLPYGTAHNVVGSNQYSGDNFSSVPENCVYFPDASGDYISGDLPSAIGTSDFTLEYWVWHDDYSNNQIHFGFGQYSPAFYYRSSSSQFAAYHSSGISGSYNAISNVTPTAGKWYHFAWVVDSTANIMKCYVDGIERDSFGYTGNVNSTGFRIGNDRSANHHKGYISNLRLTTNKVYTSNFTPPSENLTAISGTVLLTCQGSTVTDASTNNISLTVGGNVAVSKGSPMVRETEKNAVYFDGSGDVITFATAETAGTGEYTAECFFMGNTFTSNGFLLGQRTGDPTTGQYDKWILYVKSNGQIGLYNGVSGDHVILTTAGTVVTNRWYHLAITRNSSNTVDMWLDGVNVGTRTNQTANWNHAPFSIGANANGDQPFKGWISNVRWTPGTAVYQSNFTPPTSNLTALTNTKLLTCIGGGISDSSGQNETPTITGHAFPDARSPVSSKAYLQFDGNSDYYKETVYQTDYKHLEFEDDPEFTIEAWVKPETTSATYPSFLSSTTGWSAGASQHTFDATSQSGKFGFGLNGSSGYPLVVSTDTFKHDEWHHYVLQRTAGDMVQMYVNGTFQDEASHSGAYNPALGGLLIGSDGWNAGNGKFKGGVNDVRLSDNVARYPFISEFKQLTTSNSANPDGTTVTASNVRVVGVYSSNASTMLGTAASDITVALGSGTSVSSWAPYEGGNSIYMDGGAGPTTYASFTTSSQDGLFTFASSDDFGIEYYVYHNEVVASGTSHRHINTNVSGGLGFFKAGSGDPGGSNRFTIRRKGVGNDLSIPNYINLFPPFKWHHVCVQRVSGTLQVFVNGKLVGSATSNTRTYPNGVVGFGSVNTTSDNFNGYFSNLRVVKGQGIYSSSFTPPELLS